MVKLKTKKQREDTGYYQPMHQQNYDQGQNQEQKENKRPVISPTLPINGCLWIVILTALACTSIKSCKIMDMKYKEQKAKHEMYMDSINTIKKSTVYYRGR